MPAKPSPQPEPSPMTKRERQKAALKQRMKGHFYASGYTPLAYSQVRKYPMTRLRVAVSATDMLAPANTPLASSS